MEPMNDRDASPFSRLPNEILEKIFLHIQPKLLIKNILPVCRRFYSILSNEKLWLRSLREHPLNIQLCDAEMESPDFSVVRTYDAIVAEQKRCDNWNEKERYRTAPGHSHIGVIKLFKDSGCRFFLSASKNRLLNRDSIKLWSLDMINEGYADDDSLLGECDSKASGHVRQIAVHNNQFAANMLNTIKLWDIGQSATMEISSRQYMNVVGAVCLSDGILTCSTGVRPLQQTNVRLLDIRNGLQEISSCTYDVPSIYDIRSLQVKGSTLYILFEHKLVMADIRKLKVPIQTHDFNVVREKPGFISMDVRDGLIHCCHKGGEVVVLGESDLRPCYTFQVEREGPYKYFMKNVVKSKGSVLALTWKNLRAYSVGSNPVQLGCYDTLPSEALVMDALDGDIAVGCADGSITIWKNEWRQTHNFW